MLSLLFIWGYLVKNRYVYGLLPVIAYTHYIVFGFVMSYFFVNWYLKSGLDLKYRLAGLFGLVVLLSSIVWVLPVKYALVQFFNTFSGINVLNIFNLYKIDDFIIIFSTLAVTVFVFFISILFTDLKEIRYLSYLYVFGIFITIILYNAVISPYRLVSHMGIIGLIGVRYHQQ